MFSTVSILVILGATFLVSICVGMSLNYLFSTPPKESFMVNAHVVQNPSGFKHAEAFCLMHYRCAICGYTEIIWNSRDGVTPFCLKCPRCGQLRETHENWAKDIRFPGWQPRPGQRVFIDLTRDKWIEHKKVFIERMWDNAQYPMRDRYGSKEIALQELTKEGWHEGDPDVVEFKEGMIL